MILNEPLFGEANFDVEITGWLYFLQKKEEARLEGFEIRGIDMRFFPDAVNANECATVFNFGFSVFFSNYISSKRMTVHLGCCLQGLIFVLSGF